ncbi:hypothetical protein ABK040_009881 [Willaertia magna]
MSNERMLFTKLCFYIMPGLPKEECKKLEKEILTHGGALETDPKSENITHVISVDLNFAYKRFMENLHDPTTASQTEILEAPNRPSVPLVSPQFIFQSIEKQQLLNDNNYLLCYPYVFHGLIFSCSKKVESNLIPKIIFMVRYLGGKFIEPSELEDTESFDDVTHIITESDDFETISTRDEVLILSIEWLKLCFLNKSYIKEDEYLVGKSKETYHSIYKPKTLFSNLTFLVINYPSDFTKYVQLMICLSGGKVINKKVINEDEKINYLITRYATETTKSLKTVDFTTTAQWIDDCMRACKLIPLSEKIIYKPLRSNINIPGFENLRIAVTGLNGIERSDIIYLIKQTGALYTGFLTRENNYLVCKGDEVEDTKKLIKAREWGVNLVRIEYIYDCISHWKKLNDEPYIIDLNEKKKRKVNDDSIKSKVKKKKKITKKFQISVADKDTLNYTEIILKFGGRVVEEGFTHLITNELKRTKKYLAACASGAWILKPSFIFESDKNDGFVDEEEHEWTAENDDDKTDKGLWLGIPRKWRLYHEERGHGPFYGWKVFIHLIKLDGPPPEIFSAVITAGGGVVSDVIDKSVTLALVDNSATKKTDTKTKRLKQLEIPTVNGAFFLDYFTLKETPNLEDYKVF